MTKISHVFTPSINIELADNGFVLHFSTIELSDADSSSFSGCISRIGDKKYRIVNGYEIFPNASKLNARIKELTKEYDELRVILAELDANKESTETTLLNE